MDYTFSNRISSLQPSAIREILKATASSDVIPLAAGNPAAESFPLADVQKISQYIFENEGVLALQYGVTEGYEPLRQLLKEDLKNRLHLGKDFDNLIITSGSQQVMDLTTKAFINEDDTVICENPSFIGSLNCFRSYKARLCGVPVQSDGMDMEKLEKALKTEKNVKLIYTIPNFQNPSGVTMSIEKRRRLYELARQYHVLILEDNPYGELRVSGEHIPAIKSLDTDGIVIYAGCFSKILSPGIRAGYVLAHQDIVSKLTVGKQAADVHTPMFTQLLVYHWVKEYDMLGHIEKIKDIYRRKLNLMCDLTDQYLGDFVEYVRPEGGLFVWCKLPDSVEMLDFVKRAVEKKVAVVPGTAFVANQNDETNCFRMNFSTPSDENMIKGLEILGEVKRGYFNG